MRAASEPAILTRLFVICAAQKLQQPVQAQQRLRTQCQLLSSSYSARLHSHRRFRRTLAAVAQMTQALNAC